MEEILPEEPSWEAPLAFFAALHYLALAGRAPELAAAYERKSRVWPTAREALAANREFVSRFVREQDVQTNECRRCWALLPAFLTALPDERPVDVIELGTSAGLNLCWDHFRYRYLDLAWGPDSRVVLEGEWRGSFPRHLFDERPEVRNRVGIDRRPIDLADEDSMLLLQSFVWPDQPERLARLRAAIEVWRSVRPRLIRGDFVDEVGSCLESADPDALTIVFHSVSTVYLADTDFDRLGESIANAGRRAPIAWISMEPERGTDNYHDFFLDLREWPAGTTRRLAQVHYHGAWLEWSV